MIETLQRFADRLRRAGVSVSPAELLDAARAVERTGIERREAFRIALRSTLVKRSSGLATFDAVFERFFAPPSRGRRRATRGTGAAPAGGCKSGASPEPASARTPPRRGASRRASSPPAVPRPGTGHRVERDRQGLRAGPASAVERSGRRGRLRRLVARPAAERRQEELRVQSGRTEVDPLRRRLDLRLPPQEEWHIASEVPRLVENIRLKSGRRLRRASRGRLYLRRAFRDNLSRGGVPWVLPYRTRRPRRSRVTLLVDVSWSTSRAAALFLMLASEFTRRARDTRVLAFVDRVVDVTTPIERWGRRPLGPPAVSVPGTFHRRRSPGTGLVRGGVSFAALLESFEGINLTAPSDYGRAFHDLLRSRLRPSGRDNVLVVLGDGRTNRLDPQAWAFDEIAARCGVVLWLIPEARSRWNTGDSVLDPYLEHVDVAVEAVDLQGLAAGVEELVRRL